MVNTTHIGHKTEKAKPDAYVFHFLAYATQVFFEKLGRPTEEVALHEWQPIIWRG